MSEVAEEIVRATDDLLILCVCMLCWLRCSAVVGDANDASGLWWLWGVVVVVGYVARGFLGVKKGR